MSFVIIFLVVIAALFAASFFTKRRFGVLGLALGAGAILSNLWVNDLTPMIAEAGIIVVQPPLRSLVSAALILLPALLLLSSGPTYKTMRSRVIGAGAFAVLAVAFLLEPLGFALVIEGVGRSVYEFFTSYSAVIITIGLAFAVIDILTTRVPKSRREH